VEDITRQVKIEKVIENRQEGIIVLEDIHDPHNAAAVWRSCDAFGFQKVYIIFVQEETFNPSRLGKASSSSANKWLDFEVFGSTEDCMKKLKKDGFKTIATVLDKDAKSIYETDFSVPKIAIMFGNEHRGLSPTATKMADEKMYIPMRGMVQSLNLSVTAAVTMFEITRQRKDKPTPTPSLDKEGKQSNLSVLRTSPLDRGAFKLGKEERERLKKKWR
jgi:tRNA (guanosine-2'-O-)-methyltransferase